MACRKGDTVSWIRDLSVWVMFLMLLISPVACKKKTPPAPPPPKVTVTQPVQREVTDYLELSGNTQAIKTVQLVARVSGYLEKVFFQDGQMVRKGEPLFLIQQDTYKAKLEQAEAQILSQKAQLEYAQKQLDRYSSLFNENAAAQTDVDNWLYQRDSAKGNLRLGEAQRELARLDLDYTQVSAPFDGRIDRRQKDPGNLVGPGENTVLANINLIDPIYVYFTISDIDLARLIASIHGIPGQGKVKEWPLSVGFTGEEAYPHQGHIDFASISLTPTTGTLLMRGVLSNPAGKILPGLYARVRVPVESRYALIVPATSIGNDQQGTHVLIVNAQNVVERRSVKTGPLEGNLRVIEEGLAGNERVVGSALLKAHPGSQVIPVLENIDFKGNR